MNLEKAHEIVQEAAHLIALSVRFQSIYGGGYRFNNESPAEAWDIYEEALDRQRHILSLLDEFASYQPEPRLGEWWKREDMIDPGLANEIMREAAHLLSVCARLEAGPHSEHPPALNCSQHAIAGMLHPAVREEAFTVE